jgi:hypothetical protein
MPRFTSCLALTAAVLTLPLIAGAQETVTPADTTGTGLIVGQVVDAASNKPLNGVVVRLSGRPAPDAIPGASAPSALQVMTGGDGRFVFRDLPKGSFTIISTKGGYLDGGYGRLRPGGGLQPVELEDGQRVGVVALPMWKHAAISGTIVDEAGEPVIGVPVRAMRRTTATIGRRRFVNAGTASTDDRGMYRIPMLIPDDYVVCVVSTQLALPASTLEEYTRGMQAGGPPNDPARASLQQALFDAGGGGAMMPAGTAGSIQVGHVVQAIGRSAIPPPVGADAKVFAYPTLFFPAAPSIAKAELITVVSGDERTGVDLQLRPAPMSKVSGLVIGPDGPAANMALHLVPAESESGPMEPDAATTLTDRNGAFTLLGVPPGQYLLRTTKVPRPVFPNTGTTTIIQTGTGGMMMSTLGGGEPPAPPPMPADPTLWAEVPLSVGRADVTDLTIPLRTGLRVSGRVEFDGTKEKPAGTALTRMVIMLEPVEGRGPTTPPGGQLDAGLQFKTYGVPAGKYFVQSGIPPPGWTFKSAIYQGRDLSEVPLDLESADISGVVVTFTDRPTELSGTVQTSSGVDPSTTVIVFPSDHAAWTNSGPVNRRRVRGTRTGATGAYKLTGLPAGSYYIAAVPEESAAELLDPKFLETLSGTAARVTLDDGERKTQNVRTTRVR